MDNKEILFKKTPFTRSLCEDIWIINISDSPPRVSSKIPVRITFIPKVSSLIITFPGPIPYSSDKVVPWIYGADVYYHGVKQDLLNIKSEDTEEADPNIDNIVGTSKITRSGRIFSPKISPKIVATPLVIHVTTPTATPVITPVATPTVIPVVIPATESAETRDKEVLVEPIRMKAHKEVIPEASKREMEEILKIIKKKWL